MARTTGSADLYNLIHALTTSEKGYFQKFAKRHTSGGNKYLQLFNAINKQKAFEERELRKTYTDYAVMKNYLFEMITDSMLVFHKGEGSENELLIKLFQIEFLQQKGIADKAIQLTQRAIDQACETEQFGIEDLLRRKFHAMNRYRWKIAERHEKDREHFDQLRLISNKQRELDRYIEMFNHIVHYNNLQSFHADVKTTFPKHFDTNELFSDAPLLSVSAEREKLACLGAYYRQIQDFGAAYDASLRYYKLEKRLKKEKNPLADNATLRHSLRILISACLHTNRYNEVFGLCDEMLAIKLPARIANIENELAGFNNRIYAYWGSGRHKEGEQFIAKNLPVKLIAEHSERYILYVAEMYKTKLLFEHSNNNYGEVFKSIALLQSLPLKKIAPGYYKSCELLKILLQIELNHFELLPQLITNAVKHLQSYGLMPLEKEVLLLLKKIQPGNKTEILKKLNDKINKTGQDVMLFNSFNLDIWTRILLKGQPMSKQIADGQADWENHKK